MKIEQKLAGAQDALATLSKTIADLKEYQDVATGEIAQYLRMDKGIELDIEAIRATTTRPYTLLPIDEHEAWLVHWRGVKMPIFGWVVAQEPAFIKARVTRSMDMLTPLPTWMKTELGWKPPAHAAVIDGTRTQIRVTDGDEDSFKRKYGAHLGGKKDGAFAIKGGDAWLELVAALVRDGILPYAPRPVEKENWNTKASYPELLTELINKKQTKAGGEYIQRAIDEFKAFGAVLVNYPPGSGKTLTGCSILNHFIGRVLILGDSTMLIEQWNDRVKALAPDSKADITISTYQGAGKYLDQEWDLIIFDEAQRLPAKTFSKLAFVKTKYRLGLTATPWREDKYQHLIVALCGKPVAIRWAELVNSGALRRPRIVVATVQNDAAKNPYVKSLVAQAKGRVMVFCDGLEQGQALADQLDVPFIHGETKRKLERLQESPVAVVSRVGDRGVSMPDLRMAIEVAGAGASREQFAQRVGRLLHAEFNGEFVTVFTPEEAERYRGRIFGVEAELAGEVDIEFISVGNVVDAERTFKHRASRGAARPVARSTPRTTPRAVERAEPAKALDPIDADLQLPAIATKIEHAKKISGKNAAQYTEAMMRLCWDARFSPQEIAEGKGLKDPKAKFRFSASLKGLVEAGLMVVDDDGRYAVDQGAIKRLKVLSAATRKR